MILQQAAGDPTVEIGDMNVKASQRMMDIVPLDAAHGRVHARAFRLKWFNQQPSKALVDVGNLHGCPPHPSMHHH